nr:PREDICTED: THUMP domain-containing protein 1 homolog [Megachile rotundata]
MCTKYHFSRHSNNNINRDEVIEDLAEIISKKNPGNKADLKAPELAVIVEVIRGVCLMSVAPHYYKFKKYNLLEICNIKEPANSTKDNNSDVNKASETDEKRIKENTNSMQSTIDNNKESND